jgi:conjugative relaxase-like TrwC/TraI family protein
MVRFDKPCMVVTGAVDYFRDHMAVGDYLTEEGQAEMTWAGAGAARLGLKGVCRLEEFERLCSGLHPVTGEKLMVRDKGEKRRVCYFGQISPPKDVSLLYLVGGDQRIAGWWNEAMRETLGEIEATTAARVRRYGANSDRVTGNMVAAIVNHEASRALDPQLHTHLCLLNLTFDETEERWKSVQPSAFFRHQGYFREVCYNRLARRMLGAGYALESVRSLGFHVAGVPAELRDRFSKRRRSILKEAAKRGATTQDALQSITGESRASKTKTSAAELRANWGREAGEGLSVLQTVIAQATPKKSLLPACTPTEALISAEAHVFERQSVVDDRLLLREALVAGRGHVELEGLKRALAARERSGNLLRADTEIASRVGLEAEREFTAWANSQLKSAGPLGRFVPEKGLERDQAEAVQGLLNTKDGLLILQGDAGTGKTTCLRSVVAGIERAGGQVFGCAPSAGASEVLRRDLGVPAETLQGLLVSTALQEKVRNRVLVVDEAGLVSVREMRDLCRLAARNGNRLLLVGDTKQHHAVEAGDALRCLQEFARIRTFCLTEIRRQKDPAYRKAVERLARGDAFGAFNRFSALGAVHEFQKEPALFAAAADDYVRTVRSGKSCLAISPVWSEIHDFTYEVRAQLRTAGLLAEQERRYRTITSLKWTQEERRRVANYQPGDQLVFHRRYGPFSVHDTATVLRRDGKLLVVQSSGGERRLDPQQASGFSVAVVQDTPVAVGDRLLIRANLKEAGLRNGDLAEVRAFGSDGAIKLADGRTVPAWFGEFSHGYATTSHAAQGKTVDRGILFMAEAGMAAGNLKQAYVSNSRFRESQAIYTTDKEGAREAMMRHADRKLVTELLHPVEETPTLPRQSWRSRWVARTESLLKAVA